CPLIHSLTHAFTHSGIHAFTRSLIHTIKLSPMAQSSFDVTSAVDFQEVDNAVNQARKEIGQRYDFKGSKATIDLKKSENLIEIVADDNMKMNAVWAVLQTRL